MQDETEGHFTPSRQEVVAKAQRKCRLCFAEWQTLTNQIRKMVEEHEQYTPDVFKTSVLELLPDYERAANAALAQLRIFVELKSGETQVNEREETI